MPKLKTNSGAAKRFKPIANGKFKHRRSNRNHILTKRASYKKRRLKALGLLADPEKKRVLDLLAWKVKKNKRG
jgi:large subunit ribosomal protein L35